MFRVSASGLDGYCEFDPAREADLRLVDQTIRKGAPGLKRWFVAGTPDGEPGMRMSMIGYGAFHYTVKSSPTPIKWPALGLALQKNHLSLYCSARDGDRPFVLADADRLGDVELSSTGAIRFRDAHALDLDGVRGMDHDLDIGLTAGTLILRYGRTARTVAAADIGA